MSLGTGIIIAVILVAINVAQYLGIRHEWRKARRRLDRPALKKDER